MSSNRKSNVDILNRNKNDHPFDNIKDKIRKMESSFNLSKNSKLSNNDRLSSYSGLFTDDNSVKSSYLRNNEMKCKLLSY